MDTIIGSMTALVTPFKNGKLDLEKYETLIKRQIANGVDAVSPVGTTGESATLSHKEHKECIEVAVATCKNTRVKFLQELVQMQLVKHVILQNLLKRLGQMEFYQ